MRFYCLEIRISEFKSDVILYGSTDFHALGVGGGGGGGTTCICLQALFFMPGVQFFTPEAISDGVKMKLTFL